MAAAWKAVSVLGAAIVLGMTLGGFVSLPGDVRANTEAIQELQVENSRNFDEHRAINRRLDMVLCNLNPDESWDSCALKYGGTSDY